MLRQCLEIYRQEVLEKRNVSSGRLPSRYLHGPFRITVESGATSRARHQTNGLHWAIGEWSSWALRREVEKEMRNESVTDIYSIPFPSVIVKVRAKK